MSLKTVIKIIWKELAKLIKTHHKNQANSQRLSKLRKNSTMNTSRVESKEKRYNSMMKQLNSMILIKSMKY